MPQPTPKPSLIELGLKARKPLIIGIGGGGDIIQGIPVARLLRQLGAEEIWMGGTACQWWTPDGKPLAEDWGTAVMGPTLYAMDDLAEAERLGPQVARVTTASHVTGRHPCEAHLADSLPADQVVVFGLRGGVQGYAEGIQTLIDDHGIDLVIGVDIGSDTFANFKEAAPAKTSMVDFMSVGAIMQQAVPTVYGVSGYGCDGEMELRELDERVGTVMRAGGYIGAHGLTQADVAAMATASEVYPDPVEPMSFLAAQGKLGLNNVWTHGPHGTVVDVTPLAAVMLFFDPTILAESNSRGILALKDTHDLSEVESVYVNQLKQYPESRLAPVIKFFEAL
ncbi:MAG: DUF1152 domain-containing protein [Opitutales bacterium]